MPAQYERSGFTILIWAFGTRYLRNSVWNLCARSVIRFAFFCLMTTTGVIAGSPVGSKATWSTSRITWRRRRSCWVQPRMTRSFSITTCIRSITTRILQTMNEPDTRSRFGFAQTPKRSVLRRFWFTLGMLTVQCGWLRNCVVQDGARITFRFRCWRNELSVTGAAKLTVI